MGLKLNVKMKKRIRKAVASVCLVSSVLVAAIPADYSGVAQAEDTPGPILDDHEPMDYNADSRLKRNGDFTSSSNPYINFTKDDISDNNLKELYSYEMVQNSRGQWTLRWMYTYFVPNDPNNNLGIITGFNQNNGITSLTIMDTVTPGYMIVSKTDFDQKCNELSNPNWTWTLTGDPHNYDKINVLETYFPGTYDKWVEEYNTYVATEGNIGTNFFRSISGNEMPDSGRRIWYCDQTGIANGASGDYTLIQVINDARNMPYMDSFDAITTKNLPSSDIVYAVQYKGSASTSDVIRDDNDFLYAGIQGINAIGQRAFADSESLYDMTVSGKIQYIGNDAFNNNKYLGTVSLLGVSYIGNRVFKDCGALRNVTLNDNTDRIGKEAFSGCNVLETIHIPNSITDIGFGAFSNCNALKSVDMSGSTKPTVTIGEYAFYNCEMLENITFNNDTAVYYSFGKAAFAVAPGASNTWHLASFTFPMIKCYVPAVGDPKENYSNNEGYILYDESGTETGKYESYLGDYLFAGRAGLQELVMPENFGLSGFQQRVPMNTLNQCAGLQKLVFNDKSTNATYDSILFRDVTDTSLCVYGPGFLTGGNLPSEPRKATWQAKPGSGLGYVPYVYTTADGREHYEVGEGIYRYDLEINQDDNTATIIACQFTDLAFENGSIPAGTLLDLEIPGKVGEYTITTLGKNCFESAYKGAVVKNYIQTITIVDGSIQEIGDEVFKSVPNLVSANIGNSVKLIGNNAFSGNSKLSNVTIGGGIESVGEKAFANCPKLENVTWESPVYGSGYVEIADDAFVTGGDLLYFEGDIVNGYGPFDFAMADNTVPGGKSHYINTNGTRICYRSPGPLSYYVIRDESAHENLLIDYPHYYDLPVEVRAKNEGRCVSEYGGLRIYDTAKDAEDSISANDANEIVKPSADEYRLIDQTRYLIVPEAVTSIDVKTYFMSMAPGNDNFNSQCYIRKMDEITPNVAGVELSREALYSNDSPTALTIEGQTLDEFYKDTGGYHAGLFSGYYKDSVPLAVNGINLTELQTKGNDWIHSIEITGVTKIPDYTFDSCEMLQSVIISDACQEIGTAAFQNCNSLTSIGTGNSTKYIFDNYLLYEMLDDGTYELNTCLEARGKDGSGNGLWVNSQNDPLLSQVSSLNEHVFTNCGSIATINLSDTSIKAVPDETFKGCRTLVNVVLPDTVRSIGEDVFKNTNSPLDVTIPHDVTVTKNAFDNKITTTIWTYPTCELITGTFGEEGDNKYPNIYVRYLGSIYKITYLNDDNSIYEVIEVEKGGRGYYPEEDPTPKLPTHQGFDFEGWLFDNDNKINNVTENRTAMALFVDNATTKTYTITYYNDDMSVYETVTVLGGYNGYYPENNPTPKLAMHSGYQFSGWNFDNENKIYNVREDRMAIATFSLNGSNTPSANQPNDPSVSGNGTGNNPSDGTGNNPSGGTGNNNNNNSSGSNNNNGSTSGNSASSNAANTNGRYNVIVENGAGGGYYAPGSVVTITAYAAPSGKVFDRWTTSNTDIGFSNAFGASTTFIMPTHEVKVTATYKIPSASSNRVSQNSTTNNTNNKNSNTNNTSSSGGTRNPSGGGTDVTVTTTAIDNNNKNLASATVSGSTDNFVVKITDSAAASAAVEQALRAQYGDLSNIRFVGFDISLYDETGTRKIENTAGLAVNITIPIPDELVPYAGNNMAAGVVNGVLDPMAVKFTTIDGVPCMQFTATHFSPYTIYVNTNNLVSGVTDTTPKTGDIHPKWFLAIGLACISGVLFTWKDKRKVPV